ncbi:MAG: hypothetical protein U1F87_09740 [Kiritimatiellia bacterium]
MFPALVRYDECQRGVIEHALRIVVARTRRAYFYPATHYASSLADNAANANIPAMDSGCGCAPVSPPPSTGAPRKKPSSPPCRSTAPWWPTTAGSCPSRTAPTTGSPRANSTTPQYPGH